MTLSQRALAHHALPTPGKLSVEIIKAAATPDDLAQAYSPPCLGPLASKPVMEGKALLFKRFGGSLLPACTCCCAWLSI